MKKITEKYRKEARELKRSLCGLMGDSIQDMDMEELKILQACLEFIDTSNNLLIESAMMLDEMNTKLDLLLKK